MTPDTANRIDGRVVLVTGASRGIGRATAEWLAAIGGTVFGTATSEPGAEKICERLGEGRGLVLDVTDPDAINETVALITERAGAVTVLVNNAAITRDQL
ncbi:MAG TPA: SDR family NAD(P)-dependent oxidoreductase, partial [Wenzhouxiangella sp.]|nr:SDR family NAD(P)-dependent oxidoreductase [Wenzhouxiangella sp.]